MGRLHPDFCKHGKCVDPGDESFGLEVEPCVDCELEAGRCRHNCRTNREAWLAAIEFFNRYADEHDCLCPDEEAILEGYRKWREEQRG